MSHQQEIIISKDRGVLAEFANPHTYTVCWDASDDLDFQEAVENVRAFNEKACHMTEEEVRSIVDQELRISRDFSLSMLPEIDEYIRQLEQAFIPCSDDDNWERMMRAPSHKAKGSAGGAHVDDGYLAAFCSYNPTMEGTLCLSSQFAGPKGSYGSHPSADKSRAIALPGASVYLIKLDKQVHFAPQEVPSDIWRFVDRAKYRDFSFNS